MFYVAFTAQCSRTNPTSNKSRFCSLGQSIISSFTRQTLKQLCVIERIAYGLRNTEFSRNSYMHTINRFIVTEMYKRLFLFTLDIFHKVFYAISKSP